MKRRVVFLMAVLLGFAVLMGAPPAGAEEKVYYTGNPMDFSKIYTFLSRVWEQSLRDYADLVNQRGGINGYRWEPLIADHANEPQRVIEIYENMKKQGALLMNTASTPTALAILPRCAKDKIVLFTPMHGRGDAVIGEAFPWVFPFGAMYQSKAAAIVEYIYKQEKMNLKGKKIAYVYIDTPFGQEVLPVVERLGQKLGFNLSRFGYPPPGSEQSSIWSQVRRFRPDWVILWGAGNGQSVAVKEALRNAIPAERITSCDWLLEPNIEIVGKDRAKGVIRVEGVAPGKDFPVIQDLLKEIYAKGKGHGDVANVGGTLYNVGIGTQMPEAEACRIALEMFGEPLTSEKLRKAFENFKNFNCGGLTAPVTTSPQDHEGGGGCRLSQWDGEKFTPVTDWFVSMFRPVVLEVARESAAKHKAEAK